MSEEVSDLIADTFDTEAENMLDGEEEFDAEEIANQVFDEMTADEQV